MIQQDFECADEILEYAAKLIEDTDISDAAGIWAKKKRDREDADLRLKTAEDIRRRCAAHIRAMKKRPELSPIETLRDMADLPTDSYLGHVMHLRGAWPLAWKGWLDIQWPIITMTKQDTIGRIRAVPGESSGAGATATLPALMALQRLSRGAASLPSDISQATALRSVEESTVDVWVAGLLVPIPEHALSEPLAVLELATEGHVRLQDYATAVGRTLGVLANRGLVKLLV